MKKTFLGIFILLCTNLCSAQDTIITVGKVQIKSKVLVVGDSIIKYRKFENGDSSTYTLKTKIISEIRYSNGAKKVFNKAPTTTATVKPKAPKNYNVVPQSQTDSSTATLEETLSWIKSKVNDKTYKISYKQFDHTKSAGGGIGTIDVSSIIAFSYNIDDMTISINIDTKTASNSSYSDFVTKSYKLNISEINLISLECVRDTSITSTTKYRGRELSDYYREYGYFYMNFTTKVESAKLIIPDKFIYDRLVKAFVHAIKLATKTEKF